MSRARSSRTQKACLAAILAALVAFQCMAAERGSLHCSICKQKISGDYYRLKHDGKTMIVCKSCGRKLQQENDASALRCAKCGKKISGRYVVKKQGGKKVALCRDCARSLIPHCAECGRSINGQAFRIKLNGKNEILCKNCMQHHLPQCAICGKRISGRYTRMSDGTCYCSACMQFPHCPLCSRPVEPGTAVKKGGREFCAKCAVKVRVCECCGKAIMGKYYVHAFSGGVFCGRCEKERPKCVSCNRPIRDDPIMIGGKRPMCRDCFRDAILTRDKVLAVFAEVQSMIAKQLGMRTRHQLPVTIVDEIAEVQKGTGLKVTGKERGLFKRRGDDFHIYIQYGLSAPLTYETMPHEWTHAWFAENGNPSHPQWVEEGFCQWVAAHVLESKGFARGLKILQTRRDLYGRGYRYIKAIEDKGGVSAVLRYVKSAPGPGMPGR